MQVGKGKHRDSPGSPPDHVASPDHPRGERYKLSPGSVLEIVYIFFNVHFFIYLLAHRSVQARDGTHATALTKAQAVTPAPQPADFFNFDKTSDIGKLQA